MKRILSILLTIGLIMSMGLGGSLAVYADTPITSTPDITAPVLIDISFSSLTINTPQTIEMIVDSSDDLSGATQAMGSVRNPINGAEIQFFCYSYYWEGGITREYSDGKLHGTIEFGQYAGSGDYYISSINIYDKAGNSTGTLWGKGHASYESLLAYDASTIIPTSCLDTKISVTNSEGTADITPPSLSNITFSNNAVDTPESIEIVIDASDDLSGVEQAMGSVRNPVSGAEIQYFAYAYYYENGIKKDYADGKLHGTIEFSYYAGAGDYYIASVYISDKAGNNTGTLWGKGHASYESLLAYDASTIIPTSCLDTKISVTNTGNADDTAAPTLSDISFSKTTVETPESIEMVIDASDDLSGANQAMGSVRNPVSGVEIQFFAYAYYWEGGIQKEYSDNKLHATIEFGQYAGSGDYYISSIIVYDKTGNNTRTLWGKGHASYESLVAYDPTTSIPSNCLSKKITVINTGRTPDVITSTANSNLVTQIAGVVDDGLVVVDFTNNPDISSDVFTTIAGTNKEVTFTSSGISWQFKGADVDSFAAKNINLAVDIETADQDTTPAGESIKGLAGEESPALILHFADNGQLPGKATIRVKADYVLRNYLGSTGLNVYFWDSTNNVLVPIASNVSIDNNGDILFDITHCSYYVIVGRQEGSAPAIYDPTVAFIECDEESYSENYIDDLIWQLEEIAEEGTVQTIIWNQGTALPEGVMSFLKDHPKLTLIFNYSYEGKEYSVTIPGSKAIVDPEIPWYGPMWLYAHYSGNVVAKNGTASKSGVYIVQAGDTLNKIAQSKGVTLEHIKSLNPSITNVNRIFIGQSINY